MSIGMVAFVGMMIISANTQHLRQDCEAGKHFIGYSEIERDQQNLQNDQAKDVESKLKSEEQRRWLPAGHDRLHRAASV
jgi:hypothetical protein